MRYSIQFKPDPSFKDVKQLAQHLNENDYKQKGVLPCEYFYFFIKRGPEIVGGIYGYTMYGACYTDLIWVEESIRGQGYGKALLDAAEEFSQERGCTMATLCTMDWQAKDWYERQGYKIDFQKGGYANNSICYFMSKIF